MAGLHRLRAWPPHRLPDGTVTGPSLLHTSGPPFLFNESAPAGRELKHGILGTETLSLIVDSQRSPAFKMRFRAQAGFSHHETTQFPVAEVTLGRCVQAGMSWDITGQIRAGTARILGMDDPVVVVTQGRAPIRLISQSGRSVFLEDSESERSPSASLPSPVCTFCLLRSSGHVHRSLYMIVRVGSLADWQRTSRDRLRRYDPSERDDYSWPDE